MIESLPPLGLGGVGIPGSTRILLVEDSNADARLLQELLRDVEKEAHFEVYHVKTLADAEESVRSGRYDCVLLDLHLPDASGIENVERLRTLSRRAAIIVLTGLDDNQTALEALKRGAQDYLVKGSHDGAQLLRVILHAMERHRLLSELDFLREQHYFLASHDPLTGLPNRQLFEDRARRALANAERGGGKLALLCVDLDNFKPVNDTYGHAVGDVLLRRVAKAMAACLREGDTVARIGGDEFLVLLPTVSDVPEAEQVANRLIEQIKTIHDVDGRPVSVTASAGLALFPDDAQALERLTVCADKAMYASKRNGRARLSSYDDKLERMS